MSPFSDESDDLSDDGSSAPFPCPAPPPPSSAQPERPARATARPATTSKVRGEGTTDGEVFGEQGNVEVMS